MHNALGKVALYIVRKEPFNFLKKGAMEWFRECIMYVC